MIAKGPAEGPARGGRDGVVTTCEGPGEAVAPAGADRAAASGGAARRPRDRAPLQPEEVVRARAVRRAAVVICAMGVAAGLLLTATVTPAAPLTRTAGRRWGRDSRLGAPGRSRRRCRVRATQGPRRAAAP